MANTTAETTPTVGETIHNHHQEILDTFASYLTAIVDGSTKANPGGLVSFLKSDLLPHAQGEEAHMYPAMDPLIKAHGSAVATMKIDHEYITGYINKIEAATAALNSASPTDRPALLTTLQHLCLQLEAVLVAHLDKEERVYIPLLEKYVPVEEQESILGGMHEAYDEAPTDELLLDVRVIAPRERHELIFDTYASLLPNETFVLINDHDPKPLYYQFSAEHPGRFTWDYLEKGPETWRVRIGSRETPAQ